MSKSVSDALLRQAGSGNDPLAPVTALMAQDKLDEAQGILESLLRSSPNRADAWFALGQVHARRNEFKPAAKAFKRALQIEPQVADGYVHLGNTYLRAGRLAQALETYRKGLGYAPGNPLLHFNVGVALRQNGDFDGAIASYRQAINLYPAYAQAYFSLGNAYRDSSRPTEAEQAYRQAIAVQPAYADAHANLAGLLATKNDYEGAVQYCLSALDHAPRHVHALRNLSLSLYKLGRYTEGAEVTFRALAVAPDETMLHYHMGEILYGLMRTGDAQRAQDFARRWRDVSAGNAVASHMAAAILGDGTPDRAEDAYVRETFDRFAQDFESTLAGLGYRVPEMLCGAMQELLNGRTGLNILDAGCGTGLCAPHLKPIAASLVGVDLSGGMLEKARARGLYTSLHEAELGAFLAASKERYDLAIAADVFCYFGALQPTFSALAERTAGGGLFGFTVESMQGDAPAEGYRLGSTGRYQHDEAFVRSALEQSGFSVVRFEKTQGREEMGQPVPCFLVVAQRA